MGDDQPDLIRRIASVLGHELRNPLAVINNSAYFVRAKLGSAGLDPKVEKHLKIIESEISRADGLIGDMLAYVRPHEAAVETKVFDAVVKSAVAAYEPPAGVKLDVKLGAKDAKARVDVKGFNDALNRVLDNAVDAMGSKGAAKIATGVDSSVVFVTVADGGLGVAAEVKSTLFDPFVTSKPRGLGLGLSLARKYLEAVGGKITVESTPTGSTFRLSLPKAR